jgi:hypothetical protein
MPGFFVRAVDRGGVNRPTTRSQRQSFVKKSQDARPILTNALGLRLMQRTYPLVHNAAHRIDLDASWN